MRLLWSHLAKQEIVKLRRYSLKNWGREVAVRYMSDIRDIAKAVAKKPERGRLLRDNFRIVRVRSHYLIYKIDDYDNAIIIARVLHVAMDIMRHLP